MSEVGRSRPSWMALGLGGLVVVPLLALLAAGLSRSPKDTANPLVGEKAPPFSLPRLEGGERTSLAELLDRPVVINFWATWCRPCRTEHERLAEAAEHYGDRVRFVGVVYQDTRDEVRAWLERFGAGDYPTLLDVGSKAAVAYGVTGVPETFFVGADGRIRSHHEGPVDTPTLKERIEELLDR